MVHQDPPHEVPRDSDEVRAVLPVHELAVNQAQVNLIDERGGLERMRRALPGHVMAGQTAQLVIDDRD